MLSTCCFNGPLHHFSLPGRYVECVIVKGGDPTTLTGSGDALVMHLVKRVQLQPRRKQRMLVEAFVVRVAEREFGDVQKSEYRAVVVALREIRQPDGLALSHHAGVRRTGGHLGWIGPQNDPGSLHSCEPPNGSRLSCGALVKE